MMNEAEAKPAATGASHAHNPEDEMEDYGGGLIQARHGGIQLWLLAVYLVLFLWALYYLYVYWGGLGPGLDLTVL